MTHGALFFHFRLLLETISNQPTLWPFLFFLPLAALITLANQPRFRGHFSPWIRPAVATASGLTLAAAFGVAAFYLSANVIFNPYGTLCSMTSWVSSGGAPLYSGPGANEPYSLPYGPYGFMIVGWFQQALGPSLFSSKLPPFLATVGSWVLLYLALRKMQGWLAALALTALAVALPIPFDPLEFWVRPDPFLTLAASAGLWASTRRKGWAPLWIGALIGFAVNLKLYAFAFFFVPVVVTWRVRKSPVSWGLAGLLAAGVMSLPFVYPNISLMDYVRILKMDSGAVLKDAYVAQYMQWWAVLGMIALAPFYVTRFMPGETSKFLRANIDVLGALLLSFLLVLVPSSKDGANAHHLMPLVPSVVFVSAWLLRDLPGKPFLQRDFSTAGLSLALSIVIFAEMFCVFFSAKKTTQLASLDSLARRQIPDLVAIYKAHGPCILLNAATPLEMLATDSFRAILVFNGMPIGIDPAATEDYKALGHREPNLPTFIDRLESKDKLPVVWVCQRGMEPFSGMSLFTPYDKIYSDRFIDDFHRNFRRVGSSTYFDIYLRSK
jgi:hypothetical protein